MTHSSTAILSIFSALFLVAFGITNAKICIRPEQSAGVKGHLMCDGKPAANVRVKLYDKDRFISMDDKLDDGHTDSDGFFKLAGSTCEITTIDPKVYIYHDCNDWLPCQRRFGIAIPKKYVSEGAIARKFYDVGNIELSGKFSGETRDCIH